VVARRSAFLALSSAQNGGDSKGEAKHGRLRYQFSQVEVNLIYNP